MTTTTTPDAVQMPPLPKPDAWVSFDVLTQKERLDRLPIVSLNPLIYQHGKLFSEATLHAHAAQRCAELEARLAVADARVAKLICFHKEIVDLSEGWDDQGSIGPKQPWSWESIGRMALDFSQAALTPKERS